MDFKHIIAKYDAKQLDELLEQVTYKDKNFELFQTNQSKIKVKVSDFIKWEIIHSICQHILENSDLQNNLQFSAKEIDSLSHKLEKALISIEEKSKNQRLNAKSTSIFKKVFSKQEKAELKQEAILKESVQQQLILLADKNEALLKKELTKITTSQEVINYLESKMTQGVLHFSPKNTNQAITRILEKTSEGKALIYFDEDGQLSIARKGLNSMRSFPITVDVNGSFRFRDDGLIYDTFEDLLASRSFKSEQNSVQFTLLSKNEIDALQSQIHTTSKEELEFLDQLKLWEAGAKKTNQIATTIMQNSELKNLYNSEEYHKRTLKSAVHLSVEYMAQGAMAGNKGVGFAVDQILNVIVYKKSENFQKLKSLLEGTHQLSKLYHDITSKNDQHEKSAQDLSELLKSKIMGLTPGESLFFPVYTAKHAMMAVVTKNKDNPNFIFRLHNEGEGLRYHEYDLIDGVKKFQSTYRVDDLSLEQLCGEQSQFIYELVHESATPQSSTKNIYENVLKAPLNRSDNYSEWEDPGEKQYQTSGQVGGSCTAQCVLSAVKTFLTPEETAELKRELRLQALELFYSKIKRGIATTDEKLICLEISRKLQHSYQKKSQETPYILNQIEYNVKNLLKSSEPTSLDIKDKPLKDKFQFSFLEQSPKIDRKGEPKYKNSNHNTSQEQLNTVEQQLILFKQALNSYDFDLARGLLKNIGEDTNIFTKKVLNATQEELEPLVQFIIKLYKEYHTTNKNSLRHHTLEEIDLLHQLYNKFKATLSSYIEKIEDEEQRKIVDDEIYYYCEAIRTDYTRLHVKNYFRDKS
ncbi:MAG: hypothetical protein K0S74_38 [Chlamydiales bacterium]|jgi:hypothetical protein|nr:hypothetical protein [Chlamydiales bacterium]